MSRKRIVKAIVRYLEERNYQFLCFLGSGGFADVISVLNPAGQKVAVKIIQKIDIWAIEDEYWPTLQHPNILRNRCVTSRHRFMTIFCWREHPVARSHQ